MSKNKNKNKQEEVKVVTVEKQEENIKILNEANDDQVIEIDTSALDRELKSTDGGALVMPIRGGYSEKASKDKKESKKNNKKAEKSNVISMFLKGEADIKEVDCKSEDDIKLALAAEDLITLGKFMRTHPEILSTYFSDVCSDNDDEDDETVDVEIEYEEVPEYKEESKSEELPMIELSKKQRKELREVVSEMLESFNDKFSVRDLFKTIKKELDFDAVKFINKLLDRLDDYDVHDFNKFVRKTVNKIKGTEVEAFLKYLTDMSIVEAIVFLLDNKETGYENMETLINERFEEILKDPRMADFVTVDDESDEIEMVTGFDKVLIEIVRSNIQKDKADEKSKTESGLDKTSRTTKPNDKQFEFNKTNDTEMVSPRRTSNFLLNKARSVMASR